jgi:hypothetical protein
MSTPPANVGMSAEYWPRRAVTPTMRVRCSAEGIMSSAMRTSFQQNRAFRIPTDSSAGRPSGSMIRAYTPYRELPSMRAASTISAGMPL